VTSAYEARLLRRYAELVGSGDDGSGDGFSKYIPHKPHPKQLRFLELTEPEALYGGAAGGGKSDALLMDALQFVTDSGHAAIIFRKTVTDLELEGGLIPRSHDWLGGTDAHWNGHLHAWKFPSGASLTFGYMDNPRAHFRYKSTEFTSVAFDQIEEHIEAQYDYMKSRIRAAVDVKVPRKIRGSANPGDIGHDWVKRRFGIPDVIDFEHTYRTIAYDNEKRPYTRVFLPARLPDNPTLGGDDGDYAKQLAQLDPVTYQQLRFGAWVRDVTGLVYSSFSDRCIVDSLPELPEGERWTFILAADFGVVDPTAFAVLAFSDHDPNVYVVESAQWKDMAPSEAAEEAIRWERRYGGFDAIVGDVGGLGKGFEAEWRKRFALPMRAAQKTDKLGYIKLVNGDFHNKKLLILRAANEQLIKDVRALAWADDKHVKEHPTLPNHLPDAMLYGWREARHWDWSERAGPPLVGDAKILDEARERKERRMERAKREADTDSNEWILGP
jgi:hypothetical protein